MAVITFCQFLYEVYELCFTVCLLQLLLFASSCMKSMSCVSQFIYYSYYFLPVLECIQELAKSNNCSKQTDLIIMEFTKAFDKVPHCRLLYKLKFYGIQKDISNWIKAFLSDRTSH
jgi:hypothetical protein